MVNTVELFLFKPYDTSYSNVRLGIMQYGGSKDRRGNRLYNVYILNKDGRIYEYHNQLIDYSGYIIWDAEQEWYSVRTMDLKRKLQDYFSGLQ